MPIYTFINNYYLDLFKLTKFIKKIDPTLTTPPIQPSSQINLYRTKFLVHQHQLIFTVMCLLESLVINFIISLTTLESLYFSFISSTISKMLDEDVQKTSL